MPQRLVELNIDLTRPGFYDEPAFVEAEKADPRLLNAYAAHVRELPLDEGYLRYARDRVTESSAFLFEKLKQDGRKGACVDVSQVLMRFLERQGVWSYMVKGAVTLIFPDSTIPEYHFYWETGQRSNAVAPHMWLTAPPFKIVDLTLGLQEYEHGEGRFLGEPFVLDSPATTRVQLTDLVHPDVVDEMRVGLRRKPLLADVPRYSDLLTRMKALGMWQVERPGVVVKYFGYAVSAPDGEFENAANLILGSKRPFELWTEFVKLRNPPTGYNR